MRRRPRCRSTRAARVGDRCCGTVENAFAIARMELGGDPSVIDMDRRSHLNDASPVRAGADCRQDGGLSGPSSDGAVDRELCPDSLAEQADTIAFQIIQNCATSNHGKSQCFTGAAHFRPRPGGPI